MFDWWDWGHSMEKTTDALAGINHFMGYATGVLGYALLELSELGA